MGLVVGRVVLADDRLVVGSLFFGGCFMFVMFFCFLSWVGLVVLRGGCGEGIFILV